MSRKSKDPLTLLDVLESVALIIFGVLLGMLMLMHSGCTACSTSTIRVPGAVPDSRYNQLLPEELDLRGTHAAQILHSQKAR